MTKAPSVVEAIYLSKFFAPHLLDLFDFHSSQWEELNTLGQFAHFWKDDHKSLFGFINSSDYVYPFSDIARRWLHFLQRIEPHSETHDFETVLTICINLFVFRETNGKISDLEDYLTYAVSYGQTSTNILPYIWLFNPLNEPSDRHLFKYISKHHTEQTILQSLIDLYNFGANYTVLYSPSLRNKQMARCVETILPFIPARNILNLDNTTQLAADNLGFARWLSEQQQNLLLHVVSNDLDDSKDCPRKM